ncbi:MAG: hypothetical protein VYC34_12050, partial [Planctomycetota bacterium]|nr:hypothetical protein [Planctomycetota bacterium]
MKHAALKKVWGSRRLGVAALVAGVAGLTMPLAAQAAEGDELALRRISLYRSGVGYFEHSGRVEGNARVSLVFDADHINDVLKSLVVLDLDGGQVSSVGYDTKAPLEKRLASFGLNIADNPSLAELFARLRGVEVRITTAEGPIKGTVLGVETRLAASGVNNAHMINQPCLNLLTESGIRAIPIANASTFEILDERTAEELREALAALASARAERTAEVDLEFMGTGSRRAVVAYTHETPVWKTTYRLVLPEETGGAPSIQGWAIVENTTDQDWEDVRLSLAAGRPVSFVMDLHEPVYAPRAHVPVPLGIAVAPRLYESGMAGSAPIADDEMRRSGRERQELFSKAQESAAAPAARSSMDLA